MPDIDVLIVGGGVAGAAAARELREIGFSGSVMLASRELDPPYARPPITKGLLSGTATREDGLLLEPSWWSLNDVELATRTGVLSLDTGASTAKLANKEVVSFAHAVIATGAMVRRLQVDGARLGGIHYLRAPGNAEALRTDIESAERVAVIGGSYVGCEVAATLTALGKRCTVILQEERPLERGFGTQVGDWCASRFRERQVELVPGAEVVAFAGEDRVGAVLLGDGRRIETDAVVIGVGATPDVMLAKKSGLTIGDTGGIACNADLQTSAERIFAAGDACEYEWRGRRLRVEHHEHAAAQGRTAARNIAGSSAPHTEVPYFWTDLSDWTTLEYVGAPAGWDQEEVVGEPEAGKFAVRYLQDGGLVAALSCGRPDVLDDARKALSA